MLLMVRSFHHQISECGWSAPRKSPGFSREAGSQRNVYERRLCELAHRSAHGRRFSDFGCGCGCVLRRWRRLDARIYGTDINSRAIKWCRANLPFVEVSVNALAPPLSYGNASFDLVYALSVFTHLPIEMQFAWRDELRRVMRPGGHLLLTLHGEAFTDVLTPEERAVREKSGCVVRWAEAAGANLCTTFHSPAFVHDRIADGWEIVEHVPCGADGNPPHDLVVLRKPRT